MTRGMGGLLSFLLLWPGTNMGAAQTATAVATALVTTGAPDADILDDFNDNNDTNYWDGGMGTMEASPGNDSISRSFDTAGAFSGRSLKLAYNLNSASDWNGYFLLLNNSIGVTKNLSGYRHLSFWVKGSVGGVEHLKIGLENTSAPAGGRNRAGLYVNDYLDGGITNDWQKVSIPVAAFANLDGLTNAKTLTFVFERSYADAMGYSRTATVLIDDIRFSGVSLGVLRVDHFGDNWGPSALGGNWGGMGSGVSPTLTFDPAVFRTSSRSLRSNYNVSSSFSWQGHWLVLGGGASGFTAVPVNAFNYRYFRFYARARSAGENPGSFKLEIESPGRRAIIILTGLTTSFLPYVVDLNNPSVASQVDKTSIQQINIVYENTRAVNKIGAVYFDDIEFSETP